MDITPLITNFIAALEGIPNVTVVSPSYLVTQSNCALPAILLDVALPDFAMTSESVASIELNGVDLELEIDVPFDQSQMGTLFQTWLALTNQVIPLIDPTFPDLAVTISNQWCAVVPFGRGHAFGGGFTLSIRYN